MHDEWMYKRAGRDSEMEVETMGEELGWTSPQCKS